MQKNSNENRQKRTTVFQPVVLLQKKVMEMKEKTILWIVLGFVVFNFILDIFTTKEDNKMRMSMPKISLKKKNNSQLSQIDRK
jgi:hypothetical protein